ncbi:hypothetical protein BGW38_002879 [Lunasporangiospora selenospora]|uniref:Uncharacterized protein n=1 Tax=Lunasporangiospora selenospora TaxID=979761 RepID=A0A9P6FRF9_9FUNG|nr:hypothetical protein BGW38_002879 [Lunasporangiospora selenospora]
MTGGSDDIAIDPADEPEKLTTLDVAYPILMMIGMTGDFHCLTGAFEEWLNTKYPNMDEESRKAQDDADQAKLSPNLLDELPSYFSTATVPESAKDESDNSVYQTRLPIQIQ